MTATKMPNNPSIVRPTARPIFFPAQRFESLRLKFAPASTLPDNPPVEPVRLAAGRTGSAKAGGLARVSSADFFRFADVSEACSFHLYYPLVQQILL
jgi:hypothetical protein